MDKCGGRGEDVRNFQTSNTSGSDRLNVKQNEVEKKKNEDEIEVIGVVEVVLETQDLQHKTSTKGEQKRKSKSFFAGILLAICSSVCFALTNVIVKCTVGVSRAQLAVFRYFGNLFI